MSTGENKSDILSMTKGELKKALDDMGEKSFRAGQIFDWLHREHVETFDEMTNISKDLRTRLFEKFVILNVTIAKRYVSEYDNTIKYLFMLKDGEYVESVVMEYKYGLSICISTQVGCNMGCRFCASALDGKARDLKPSEMLYQIYAAQKDMGRRISHVVLMGMGEPLDNFENVMRFIDLVTDADGQNLSMRHLSLSTCGLTPKISQLMEKNLQLTLSVSLHAPNDEIRKKIMPVAKRYNITELLDACRKYSEKTKRRISFEYLMIDGLNDSVECAQELSSRLKGMLCHVNLIPANEVEETGLKSSSKKTVEAFASVLTKNGITATVRRKLGSDINASCGQLRRSQKKTKADFV